MIPYGRQDISEGDIDAVIEVLRSDYLTQGPVVPTFESAVAGFCKAEYAVAVNSATSALHIACLALEVGPGDVVWSTPITFVASVNCAVYCGAQIDFVDIDPRTYCMSVDQLHEKLEQAERDGCLPKVVIPVHMCGQPCDLEGIHALSKVYNFRIIEDASHAIGGRYKDLQIGNCDYSDITVFSFHPVKIITTGEGGMALTNDHRIADRMRRLRTHGITRNPDDMNREPDGPWYYEQIDLGFNYRMTELQAVLGLNQMKRLNEFVARRHTIAQRYDEVLRDLQLITPWQHPDGYSALHLYVIRLKLAETRKSHLEVFESLRSAGIGVNLHYIPVYRQPYYERLGFSGNLFPEAERYYSEAITLPLYPDLTETQQNHIVDSLQSALTQ